MKAGPRGARDHLVPVEALRLETLVPGDAVAVRSGADCRVRVLGAGGIERNQRVVARAAVDGLAGKDDDQVAELAGVTGVDWRGECAPHPARS